MATWKFMFVILTASQLGPSSCQLDHFGFLRTGFRAFAQDSEPSPLIYVEKEAEDALSNSVHGEKILSGVGFITAAVKRAFGLIAQEPEIQVVDKHHKRTNLIEVAKKLNLTTFLDKAKEAGIDDILDHEGQFTVFAPTNDAFERTPKFCSNVPLKDLMRFHVSKGSVSSSSFKNNLILRTLLTRRGTRINVYQNNTVVTANGRRLNQTDFKASNGILHMIDDVMCAVYRGSAAFAVNRCPKLTILSKAINLTSLYSQLDRTKRLSLFAPTDDAFSKIPQEVLDNLLNNATALLEVLQNHVVPDVWYSAGLQDGQTLTTLLGQNLSFSVAGNITVNGATIVAADATVKNGVVHGIDTVLLPTSFQKQTTFDLDPIVLLA